MDFSISGRFGFFSQNRTVRFGIINHSVCTPNFSKCAFLQLKISKPSQCHGIGFDEFDCKVLNSINYLSLPFQVKINNYNIGLSLSTFNETGKTKKKNYKSFIQFTDQSIITTQT